MFSNGSPFAFLLDPLRVPALLFAFSILLGFCSLFCSVAYSFLHSPSLFYYVALPPSFSYWVPLCVLWCPHFFLLGPVRFPLGSHAFYIKPLLLCSSFLLGSPLVYGAPPLCFYSPPLLLDDPLSFSIGVICLPVGTSLLSILAPLVCLLVPFLFFSRFVQ